MLKSLYIEYVYGQHTNYSNHNMIIIKYVWTCIPACIGTYCHHHNHNASYGGVETDVWFRVYIICIQVFQREYFAIANTTMRYSHIRYLALWEHTLNPPPSGVLASAREWWIQ